MAQDASDLAAQVQARAKTIDSLSADYERYSRFAAAGSHLRREVKGEGRLHWARELNLRLEQKTPRRENVIANAQSVWWVRPERKRADRYAFTQFTGGLKPLLQALGGMASLDESFDLAQPSLEEKALGRGGQVLVLIPKQKRADLTRLIIWFQPGELIIQGFRMINLVGDITEYLLKDVKINSSLPSDYFTYSPPQDFKVIDRGKADQ